MAGSIYITNHDDQTHHHGKTRLVQCTKACTGKKKNDLTYQVGVTYVCQQQTPSSNDWLVFLVSRDHMHDGFSVSYEYLMDHFMFVD